MRDPQPEKAICEAVTLVRTRLLPFFLRGHSITTWKRWGEGSKFLFFCPRSGYKNCPHRGGGQKMTVHLVVEWPLSWIVLGLFYAIFVTEITLKLTSKYSLKLSSIFLSLAGTIPRKLKFYIRFSTYQPWA